jgi:aspartate/tyrosine/aromatic aminotransferase
MEYKDFFETLNENIRKSTTERSLKNLERIGENYVKNVLKNPNISMLVKKDVRSEMQRSRKLIQKMRKKIKSD